MQRGDEKQTNFNTNTMFSQPNPLRSLFFVVIFAIACLKGKFNSYKKLPHRDDSSIALNKFHKRIAKILWKFISKGLKAIYS